MKVTPFHSKLAGSNVYHNNSNCTKGNNIERTNKIKGKGGLRLCSECKGKK